MRSFARAVTVLTALALIGGPPLLIGFWLQHRPPPTLTTDGVRDWLQQPRTATDVLAGAAIVAALLWLMLLGYLTRRGLRAWGRRWRRLRHLPLPTPAQMTAGSMAGIAALTLPTTTAEPSPEPPTTDGAPPPADPTQPDHQQQAPATRTEPGIDLPGGGWVPYRTAVAVAALATTIRLLRRRSYRPDGRQLGTHHNDPDLQPLPATAQAVIAATADGTSVHPVRPHHLPPGALRLYGPGAEAAARGLVVTAALTETATPPTMALAISQKQWNEIFPGLDHSTIPTVGLVVLPDDEIIRPTNDAGHAELRNRGLMRSPVDALPADPQPTSMTILTLGGTEPAVTHWHVAADGTTTAAKSTVAQRLCVLDPQAASDLLALVQQQRHAVTDIPAPSQVPITTREQRNGRTPPARLTLLGGCTLTVAGQPMRLRRSASMQILAYLALHPEGATRSDIITAVWPHLPPSSIVQRLHTTLSDLRRQLQPTGINPVTRQGEIYHLNTDMIGTDVADWRTTIAAARNTISEVARSDACHKLIQLYQGELAASEPWPWIQPAREQFRRDALDACIHIADHAPPAEALTWLQNAAVIDPYSAPLQARLIKLRAATGQGS